MLQLTEKAAARLESTLAELELEQGDCFRLGLTEEGIKLAVDQERPGDATIEHGGSVLLVIDAVSAGQFEGHVMDFDEVARQLTFS